jgi:predicted PhzF superfamily epimerase YddE/YHI9
VSAELHVLRVFCAEDGSGGNPLGVFLDGAAVSAGERQAVARELGFSETVFVDDARRRVARIFTPEIELDFAGHPMVGTAWLLRERGKAAEALHPPAGEVAVRQEGEETFITGRPEWGPQFGFAQVGSPEEVDGLEGKPEGHDEVGVWAWIDEERGVVRERVFVAEAGILEDGATGSAAIRLCAQLGRPLEIRQGRGSLLRVTPIGHGGYEVGGRVALEEVRGWG